MCKHHYVLLQSCCQQMKDLMWASSALVITVVVWDDKPYALVYAIHFYKKNLLLKLKEKIIKGSSVCLDCCILKRN